MSELRDRLKNVDFTDLYDEKDVEIDVAGTIDRIPKESIYSTKQVRTKFDEEALSGLSVSLEVNGQEQPIIVDKFDGKGYRIQKGERRWRAAMMNDKITHLDCIQRERSTGDIFGQLTENIQRENLNALELAHAFVEAKETHDITSRMLAYKLGKTKGYISKHITALTSHEFILDAFDAGLLGDVETINELRKAAKLDTKRVRTVVALGEPITREAAIALKDEITKKKNVVHREKDTWTTKPLGQFKLKKMKADFSLNESGEICRITLKHQSEEILADIEKYIEQRLKQ